MLDRSQKITELTEHFVHSINVIMDKSMQDSAQEHSGDSAVYWNGDEAAQFSASAKKAEKLYKFRRLRDVEFLESGLFGEPTWDMLLDLFIQHQKRRNISVTSACLAAQVPATTALRYVQILIDQGLIFRQIDPVDGRRSFLSLTPKTLARLDSLFHQSN